MTNLFICLLKDFQNMMSYYHITKDKFSTIKSLTVNKLFNLKIKMVNNMKSHFQLKTLIKKQIKFTHKKKQEKGYLLADMCITKEE